MGLVAVWLAAGAVLGASFAWLLARRAQDALRRQAELELATARAQLAASHEASARLEREVAGARVQEEQLSGLLTTARAEFARADAQARLLAAQADAQARGLAEVQAEVAAARQAAAAAEVQRATAEAELSALRHRALALQDAEGAAQRAAEALARAEGELSVAHQRGAALEGAQGELALAKELNARREAELRAADARAAALDAELADLEATRARAQQLSDALARAESQLQAERARAAERALEVEQGRETLRLQFEALAQKLLDEKGKALLDESQRSIEGVLQPVREKLKAFEDTFQRSSEQESRDRASLLERLKLMQDTQLKLHQGAESLTRALTGESRAQGAWGELVLESLLSTAGLTEGREYELQVDRLNDEGNRRRPDAVVYFPGDKALVVDSKCSLTAFVASTKAVDDAERERDLAAHVESVRTHVKLLAAKDYTSILKERTLEVTFLFVPNEAAFHAALSRDPALYEDAFRQRVLLCSPTTLLPVLQVVNHMWRGEKQTLNAQKIAAEAGRLVDKLSLALLAFDDMGQKLDGAQRAWEDVRGRLTTGRGNVVGIANRLVELGAAVRKPEKVQAALKRVSDDEEDDDGPQGQLELGSGSDTPQA